MNTTTVRVDRATHARLVEMSTASGSSLMETMREAAEALQRIRFGARVQLELAELRERPSDWDAYVAEAASTEVADGID